MSAQAGLRSALGAKRVVVLLWAMGALVALPLGLFTKHLFDGFFGVRAVAETVAAGLPPLYAVDLAFSRGPSLTAYAPLALGLLLTWVALTPLRHGLALGAARHGPRGALGEAGRVYGRLLRLAPMTWLLTAAVVGPLAAGAAKLGGDGLDGWISEKGVFVTRLGLVLGLLLVVAWLRGVGELMRAHAVVHDEPAARRAFVAGLRATLRRPLAPLIWGVVFAGGGAGLTLFVSLLDVRLPRDSVFVILVGVGLQQATALTRAGLAVAFAGAAVAALEPSEAPGE